VLLLGCNVEGLSMIFIWVRRSLIQIASVIETGDRSRQIKRGRCLFPLSGKPTNATRTPGGIMRPWLRPARLHVDYITEHSQFGRPELHAGSSSTARGFGSKTTTAQPAAGMVESRQSRRNGGKGSKAAESCWTGTGRERTL